MQSHLSDPCVDCLLSVCSLSSQALYDITAYSIEHNLQHINASQHTTTYHTFELGLSLIKESTHDVFHSDWLPRGLCVCVILRYDAR